MELRGPGKGGNSSCRSGSKSTGTVLVSAACCCVTGLTCTAMAQGILGRFLVLHPHNTQAAQQKKTMTEWEERYGKTIMDRAGLSVMFRRRLAIRFGTSCPGPPPK
jgi:hypothetical protein